MLKFNCPKCNQFYEYTEDFIGRKAQCSNCSAKFYVPEYGKVPEIIIEEEKIVISFDDLCSSTSVNKPSTLNTEQKLSPRQRRLLADQKMMYEKFSTFPYIKVVDAIGNLPEKYIVEYYVRGIERLEGNNLIYRNCHRVEIVLPSTYPRTPPTCRMLTPIFHPNIEPAVICIGDHWTAAERLCDLVVRIGEIITYQSYNIKSPLDGEAAMWADLHQDILPIDKCDLMPPEF